MNNAQNKHYEAMVVINPDLTEEECDELLTSLHQNIENAGGRVLSSARWRKRRLAYPIKKFNEGYYGIFEFLTNKSLLSEFDYLLRYNSNILRYLIIGVDERKRIKANNRGSREKKMKEDVAV